MHATTRAEGTLAAVMPPGRERVARDGMPGRRLRVPVNPQWYRVDVLPDDGQAPVAAWAV